MAVVKRLTQESIYGLSAGRKMAVEERWSLYRGGRCKEVETRFSVWTVSAKKKKNIVEG